MIRNGKRLRLLAVAKGGAPTGYARVVQSLLAVLCERFDVTHFAFNVRGENVRGEVCGVVPYRVITSRMAGDPFGRRGLPEVLRDVDPDVVLLCHDPDFWEVHRPALDERRREKGTPATLFYCPIEWEEILPGVVAGLNGMDRLVLYTEFGRNVVESKAASHGLAIAPIGVIPHGLDPERFHMLARDPEESRARARSALFPNRAELADAFIVLNANRNCPRKRIDLTLRAFAEFVHREPKEAYLYLHTGMRDSGYDVPALVAELGIADRLIVTRDDAKHPAIPDDALNLIYNACDVGLNTSTGEGWGLISIEHAACGGAQIVPNHSACAEIWSGRGMVVDLATSAEAQPGEVSVPGVADALDMLYHDRSLLRDRADAGRIFATSPRLSWRAIASEWSNLIERVVAERVA